MLVQDIMTTSVRTAMARQPVREPALVMCFHKISGLPVVDTDNRIVGVLSEKDVLRAMYPDLHECMQDRHIDLEKLELGYRDVLGMPVGEVMSARVVTVSPRDPVLKAVSTMCAHSIRRVPVAVDGRLVGIVSVGDVHKALFQQNLTTPEARHASAG
ncbi:MAG TPA: CBS domain-containing protein [Gammaproteobacteria bacterium]|nr:CBS domain-containing protein [Gammaproteobacteria bacterium]